MHSYGHVQADAAAAAATNRMFQLSHCCALYAMAASSGTAAGVAFGTPALLSLVGFGPLGPIAKTLAAWWQSYLVNVAPHSLFALLQSIAMAGLGYPVILGSGTFAGATMLTFCGNVEELAELTCVAFLLTWLRVLSKTRVRLTCVAFLLTWLRVLSKTLVRWLTQVHLRFSRSPVQVQRRQPPARLQSLCTSGTARPTAPFTSTGPGSQSA